MRINDRSPRDMAIRALRDCGVIRAHLAAGRYADLWRAGMVLASQIKPWGETK